MDHDIYIGKTEDGLNVLVTVYTDGFATIATRADASVSWSAAVELERSPIEVPC